MTFSKAPRRKSNPIHQARNFQKSLKSTVKKVSGPLQNLRHTLEKSLNSNEPASTWPYPSLLLLLRDSELVRDDHHLLKSARVILDCVILLHQCVKRGGKLRFCTKLLSFSLCLFTFCPYFHGLIQLLLREHISSLLVKKMERVFFVLVLHFFGLSEELLIM